jgi:N-acetylglucosaminyldiphosphoundecaprenol N-acetyl-beta-D-mannosaminyltransferase
MVFTILGVHVSVTNYVSVIQQILCWILPKESRYICVANVHMVMETHESIEFKHIVNHADMVVPDGMPLVWMMRLKGHRNQGRVYGPTLMLHLLEFAAQANMPVGFYGGMPDVSKMLVEKMQARFKGLKVAYAYSPPFRELSPAEDDVIVRQINESGARILFLGLGCPKQELWMAAHRGRIHAVMIGVGAAFDFHAGAKPQASAWIQWLGLEWMFRLATEPRRLWKRYLYYNPRFVVLAIADLLGLSKD